MTTNQLWLVGSIIVPLAALATFAIFYFRRYKQYLLERNSYKDCQFLEDAWKGYISAQIASEKCRTGFKLWWYIFGTRYIDLVNYTSERCVYELDQLDRFEEATDNKPCFNRKSFMRHWNGMRPMLFETKDFRYDDDYSPYTFKKEYRDNAFGWMSVMIESKLFELYKKHALQLLRTKGYYAFSEFLESNRRQSKRYPHNAPFSIIASGDFHEKFMKEYSEEIGERIQHEMKVILGTNKVPKTESHIQKLRSLVETFVLKGIHAHGAYRGIHYPGLSDVRGEIFGLLEKATAQN